jgi:hypothetical protein
MRLAISNSLMAGHVCAVFSLVPRGFGSVLFMCIKYELRQGSFHQLNWHFTYANHYTLDVD